MSIDWDGSRMESRGGIDAMDDETIRQVGWGQTLFGVVSSLVVCVCSIRCYIRQGLYFESQHHHS